MKYEAIVSCCKIHVSILHQAHFKVKCCSSSLLLEFFPLEQNSFAVKWSKLYPSWPCPLSTQLSNPLSGWVYCLCRKFSTRVHSHFYLHLNDLQFISSSQSTCPQEFALPLADESIVRVGKSGSSFLLCSALDLRFTTVYRTSDLLKLNVNKFCLEKETLFLSSLFTLWPSTATWIHLLADGCKSGH